MAWDRYSELPPVDEEGFEADRARAWLQQTDSRISRLRLPDFMASTTRRIQELGTPVAQLYSGLQDQLVDLPSIAQQAAQTAQQAPQAFSDYANDRIASLGQGIGGVFSDLGTGLQSSIAAQDALNRSVRDQEGPPPTAGQEVGPAGFTLPATGTPEGERITSGLARTAGGPGAGLRPSTPTLPTFDGSGLQALPGRLRQGVQDVGQELAGDVQAQSARMGQQLGASGERTSSVFQGLMDNPVTGSGGDPALQSLGQRLRETREDLYGGPGGGQVGKVGGSLEAIQRNQSQGNLAGAGTEAAGLGANAALAAGTVLGAIPNAFGSAAVGGLVGGERNLAQETGLNTWLTQRGLPGIQADTFALGGLANPAAAGGLAAQVAIPPTAVDDLAGMLLRQVGQGVRVTTPLVERFMREVGPGQIRVALERANGLGDLFDDFVARTAERVPQRLGGAEGPLGRLLTEETGSLRLPDQLRPGASQVERPRPRTPGVTETPGAPGVTKIGAVTQTLQAAPLISPSSQFWNHVSGALRTAQRFGGDTLGNVDRRGLGARETLADLLGMGAALPDAVGAFRSELGAVSQAGGRSQGLAATGLSSSRNRWARLFTSGTRANTAGDMFWRTLSEGGARARLAARLGVDPLDLDPNDVVQVTNRAGDFTGFVGPTSFVADGLVGLGKLANDRSRSVPTRLAAGTLASFAPYVRMPERLLAATAQLVTDPGTQAVQFVRALRRGDEYARREAQGRFLLATPLVATFVHDYFSGDLRGDPPANPAERRRQEAQGARWNTWRGVPIPRMGPPGQAAAAVATSLAAGERALLRGEHPADLGRDVVNAVGRWALSSSYLDDLSDFAAEVGEGRFAQAAEKQAVNVAARPLSAVACAVGAFDPYERAREGTGQEAQYRVVPGGRFLLPEKLDPASGEAVRRKGNPVSRYFLGSQGVETTPEGEELARYGVSAPTFRAGSEYAGTVQTGEQARALQRASGAEITSEVRDLMRSSDYQRATEEEKPALLRAAVARGRAAADLSAGQAIARDPKAQATAAWAAVPKYRGVEGTPEEIRRLNARIARAKTARAAAVRKGKDAESAWIDAHEEEYALSRYPEADARRLRLEREDIERQYGVDLG